MKKLFPLFILLSFVFTTFISAQEKELTIKDAVIGQYRDLYPEYISQLAWIPQSNNYTFVEDTLLMRSNVKSDKDEILLDLKSLNALLGDDYKNIKYFPRIQWLSSKVFQIRVKNNFFRINPFKEKLVKRTAIPANAENIEFSDSYEQFAYTVNNNLFLFNGHKHIQITNEENKEIISGQEVHRREFGINKGIFWSPDEKQIAFYRKDETMVTDYPLVDITTRVASLNNIKYPMAGMKSHHVKVGIYNIEKDKTTFLKTGEPEEKYLTNIEWGPNSEKIYLAELNRDQDHMKLQKFSASSGNLDKTLFEEKHPKYVEPLHPVKFIPNSDNQFIWQSRRDGYNHLYLYNTEGDLIKQLTEGEWEVTRFLGFGKKNQTVFFTSTKESPLDRHAYKADIKNGNLLKLTSEAGMHRIKMNSDGEYFINNYSSQTVPRKINILDNQGKETKHLLTAKNPLKDYNLGEITISKTKADDGTDLYYRLIKPSDFDPEKKYPAIIYVYGGPHAQLVTNSWLGSARMWQLYMAQKGYVMLTLDNRGSANRGLKFENIIHRNLGVKELDDQMKGVELLKESGYVDTDRIGVHGWSYGGFMTTSMMLKKPGTFKVGVAGGPVIDWKYYEIMYGERYMDTPQENPDGYKNANLKNYVTNLDGKLMLVNGAIDDVVVWQHSLSFIRECVKNNVQVDYFVYPGHQHNVRGRDRIHLMEKVTQYFEDYL